MEQEYNHKIKKIEVKEIIGFNDTYRLKDYIIFLTIFNTKENKETTECISLNRIILHYDERSLFFNYQILLENIEPIKDITFKSVREATDTLIGMIRMFYKK